MRAGLLSTRLSLQERPTLQDAAGQQQLGPWTEISKVWGDVRYQTGLEAIRADAPVSVAECSIRIRARAITAAQRLVDGATVYNIRAVLPDTTGRVYTDLRCEVGANQG